MNNAYPPAAYDESAVLRDYVWSHCRHLMTDVERRASRVVQFEEKAAAAAENGSTAVAHRLRAVRDGETDGEVEAALSDGFEVFRDRVTSRLLAEPAVRSMINRCPECSRVVRTPKARQCPWCRHDWHERDGAAL